MLYQKIAELLTRYIIQGVGLTMVIPWVILIFEAPIGMFITSFFPRCADTYAIIAIIINSIALYLGMANEVQDRKLVIILWLGLTFRLVLFLWDLNCRDIYVLPNSGQDTEMFATWAQNGFLTGDYGRGGVYARFIAFWYNFFGVERCLAQYLNVLLGMSSILLCVRTLNYLSIGKNAIKTAVLLLCFLPNFAITNSILLRETLICFLVAMSAHTFFKWIETNLARYLIESIIVGCFAAALHSGAIAVILGEAVVFCLYDRKDKKTRFSSSSIIAIIAVLVGFVVLYQLFGDTLFSKFNGVDSVADVVSTADRYNAGSSAYDAGFTINNNILSLIVNTPIRMFYFVLSPLPWNWRGVSDVIAFCFSSTVFLYAYYLAYLNIKNYWGTDELRTKIVILVILCLCSALIFAWGVSNAGTAVRHREKFVILYILLIAVSIDNRDSEFLEY